MNGWFWAWIVVGVVSWPMITATLVILDGDKNFSDYMFLSFVGLILAVLCPVTVPVFLCAVLAKLIVDRFD